MSGKGLESPALDRLMPIAAMDPRAIHYLTIHCTASPEGQDHRASEISRWDIERFSQPSYHHVIEIDGSAVRTLRDDQRGAHVGGHNTGNIGVAYVGGVDRNGRPKDTRTPAQRLALRKLVASYRARFPLLVVRGHRDWPDVRKACPSFDVAKEL